MGLQDKQIIMIVCRTRLAVSTSSICNIVLCGRQQMAVAQEPKYQVQQINSTVIRFKPVARHKEHVSDSFNAYHINQLLSACASSSGNMEICALSSQTDV